MRLPGTILACLIVIVTTVIANVPARGQSGSNKNIERLADQLAHRWEQRRTRQYHELLRSADPMQRMINEDPGVELMGIDARGRHIYYHTHNIDAAATTRTSEVWPGGGSGHNLSGSQTVAAELALWDVGIALVTHQELVWRVIPEAGSLTDSHSTHVAGTMIAAGVDSLARGMSFQGALKSFRWDDDAVEMAQQAAQGLLISNHSYGIIAGWQPAGLGYVWYGDVAVGTSEDWQFGFYDTLTAEWDQIAFSAPNYLIVKSAGNDRNDVGYPPTQIHSHIDNGVWVHSQTDTHLPDGSPFGYDTIGVLGCAKNILTVGAVKDIPGGYTQPSDVVQTDFSSWGPTDDGRIKPDIVANGDSLYSADSASDTSYRIRSGTSMSAPNVSGSINLLKDLYKSTFASTPRSATLKALVIHTADEAGPKDGPDYANGWGLLNTRAAADVIVAQPADGSGIIEGLLVNGNSNTYEFTVATATDVRVTIVWTDPAGTPPVLVIDPVAQMLVNDLDLLLEDNGGGSTTYLPWRLDKTNPLGVALRANNSVDNVERIDVKNLPAGDYRVTVSHKGTITYGEQAYSLIWTGLVPLTAAAISEGAARPPRLTLRAVYPNPASGVALVEFSSDTEGPVSIAVFDVQGRLVTTLHDGMRPAGEGAVRFDTRALPSGIYFVKLASATEQAVRKIAVVR